jgi:hypothetical protein
LRGGASALRRRAGQRRTAARGDGALAPLHGRLAVQEAAGALLDLADDRVSVTLFVDSVERALGVFGRSDLFSPLVRALDLGSGEAGIQRSLATLETFTGTLREWLRQPAFRISLSEEDLVWSEFVNSAFHCRSS